MFKRARRHWEGLSQGHAQAHDLMTKSSHVIGSESTSSFHTLCLLYRFLRKTEHCPQVTCP